MRALVYDGSLKLTDIEMAPLRSGEARIKVLLAGICNTDLEICRGYMNYQGILGHEFVGIVTEAAADCDPAEAQKWLGRRVVGEINCGCGHCCLCAQGDTRHCAARTTLGIDRHPGVMASYCTLPFANLYAVPNEVSDSQAVFTEPLAAAWNILEQVHIIPSDRVLLLGDGKLGQLCAQTVRLSGCDLTAVGKHEDKLRLLEPFNVRVRLLNDWMAERSAEPAYDIVIEATGSAGGLELALQAVRPRGTIVLKTTVTERSQLDLAPIVVHEIKIIGSRCGRFAPALRALQQGVIHVEPLIAGTYDLADGVEAFALAKKSSLKVLLRV
ncbi:MAG: alcohol dehydrogenase catalytic domain-containing protein [bacterium]|nr:alcohol dehydrogenase catalytic domain-containing protein [bacterium]